MNCYILCATGYAEESVQQANTFLQDAKSMVKVAILGLRAGAVTGAAGESLTPTTLLSRFNGDVANTAPLDGLLVAGGAACGQQLLADPRVHRLIQMMSLAARPVGFLFPVSYSLIALQDQQLSQPFLLQERRGGVGFLRRFEQQMLQAAAVAEPKWLPPII